MHKLKPKSNMYNNLQNLADQIDPDFANKPPRIHRVTGTARKSQSVNRHAPKVMTNSLVGENKLAYDGGAGADAMTFLQRHRG